MCSPPSMPTSSCRTARSINSRRPWRLPRRRPEVASLARLNPFEEGVALASCVDLPATRQPATARLRRRSAYFASRPPSVGANLIWTCWKRRADESHRGRRHPWNRREALLRRSKAAWFGACGCVRWMIFCARRVYTNVGPARGLGYLARYAPHRRPAGAAHDIDGVVTDRLSVSAEDDVCAWASAGVGDIFLFV